MTTYVVKVARHAGLVVLFVATALLGTLTGVLFAYSDDLPGISALDDYRPSTITRVVARDGSLVGDFAVERRVLIRYDEIPDLLRQAILSAEDGGFFNHAGLNISRMMLALVRDIVPGGNAPGGSTLTQQLARNLFPGDVGFDRTWERKVKEALVAIQIEKRYTKEEILTMYCNQVYFGHGAYGVEAASRLYFGKSIGELNLDEAAVIAGILQGNVRQSPYVNPEATLRRRNYTLGRMAEEGYITRETAQAAMARPIVVRSDGGREASTAPYFLEEVRKHLEARYGATALYEHGLHVQTTLDPALQRAASAALDRGLRRIDKRRSGFRAPERNVLAEGQTLEGFRHDRWVRPIAEGDVVPAIVTRVDTDAGTAGVRLGRFTAELTRESIAWTRRPSVAALVKPGDLIDVAVTAVDEEARTATVTLDQAPLLEGAVLALDNRTGEILAMVGGYSFTRSKFNRAVQAFRQMGSTFKPILYTAAIDRGLTPVTILVDEPTGFDAGAGQPQYRPRNYDGRFEGPVTLRRAIERSRNVPAVKVMEMLGPTQVVAYAQRFGFPDRLPPYLSTALGAAEGTLLELTSAYTAFPNHGVRMQPYAVRTVTDPEGGVLEDNLPAPRDAIRADTAYVMTSLLRGVVQRGTAASANALNWPLAGKTGTVDDYTDAWFIGFDPHITVGVWVGHDEKKPIGRGESGTTAALPIWIDVMRAYLDTVPDRDTPPTFDPPGNIVFMAIDRATGQPTTGDGSISEAFINGTQPAQNIRF
jgi:penicillin-binding protein 1A